MFNKIRNRILLLNMVMVSSVVIIAFAVIFVTTYNRTQNENSEKLRNAMPVPQTMASGEGFLQGAAIYTEHAFGAAISGFSQRISPDAGLSFSIIVDASDNMVQIDSMVQLLPESYDLMAKQALEGGGGGAVLTVEGRRWQYMISPIIYIMYDSSGTTATSSVGRGDYTHIRFLDVTDSHRMIISLAFLLSGSAVIVLAAVFFISRYFANRAVIPMEEAWAKQRRFITDASHELKTPLSVINANCGVLYTVKDETVESQIKWVDSIARAADRMTGLVGNLLSLASMEDPKPQLSRERFDLSGDFNAAAVEMEAAAVEKGLRLQKDIEQSIEVDSDRENVRKILSILLDNAVKYTESGGEVTLILKREKRGAVCIIRNCGEGIPPNELPHIFDRFYRADPARSSATGGYGLGLSIAKAIADQLCVAISAESEQGKYTQFKLVFESRA